MAKIKGICKNYDECDLAAGKEVQEAEKTAFVCTECGKPLYLLKEDSGDNGSGWKKWAVIAAVVIVAGGGIYFGLFHGKGSESTGDGSSVETTVIDTTIINPQPGRDTTVVNPTTINPKPGGNTTVLDLGYAIYEGDKSAGKPHGNGTLEFKSRHLIPGAEDDCVASPGEKVIGTFRNGEVNLATWYCNDGNRVVVKHK
jgi:ssDNA-binding Zn-finger/Zn-ribbon topoisomerase 1